MALTVALGASGCANLAYYTHVARGQGEILMRRQPIAKVIQAPGTDPELARRLGLVIQARDFASSRLELPDNASYRGYADLRRDFVVWNVYAAPVYSTVGVRHCFLATGCVEYQGYFNKARAAKAAIALRKQGLETYIDGVPAYSTLGWFDDPVLNTMMRWGDEELIGTIFHELAHQKFFVKGDAAFNESYANFVEMQGLKQWHAAVGGQSLACADADRKYFIKLVQGLRSRLAQIYAAKVAPETMESRKQEAIAGFREEFSAWRKAAGAGASGLDAWVAAPINNAKLVPFGLYDDWSAAFEALFEQAPGDWPRFYASVRALAKLPAAERAAALRKLKSEATSHRCDK